jgi:HrpA-like RNA helicase
MRPGARPGGTSTGNAGASAARPTGSAVAFQFSPPFTQFPISIAPAPNPNLKSHLNYITNPKNPQVFDPAPPNRRKIILSTNIAETSVTIDDIVYVLNSGIAKEMAYDASRQTGVLENQLISKANNTQRKGRAGRCQRGTIVHLFPKYLNSQLKDFAIPEILANSLEENILHAMCLNLADDPYDFFRRTVSIPPEDRVEAGVEILLNLGALELSAGTFGDDIANGGAATNVAQLPPVQLTDLGRWLGMIPQHPCATLALTYSCLFGVMMPTLCCLSFMGNKSPFDIKETGTDEVGKRGKWRGQGQWTSEYHLFSINQSILDADSILIDYWTSKF